MILTKQRVPTLRFPDFEGDWEIKKLKDLATFSKGKGISKSDISEDGKLDCIRYGELYTHYSEVINEVKSKTNLDSESLVLSEKNDVIIPASGEAALDIATASCVLNAGIALGGDLNIIRAKLNGVFLSYYLNNVKKIDIARLAQGISVIHLYSKQLKALKVLFPKKEEQQKIATFLTAIDTKIQQLTKKKSLLEAYKKGVMQQIFKQEIRIAREFPDWRNRRLNELLITSKARNGKLKYGKENVLSVSGEYGIVNQIEHMGRSYAGVSVANYHVVEVGDIVYTKSPLKANPYGIIKVNKGKAGIVSTLYAVYKIKEKEALGLYLDLYFSLDDNLNRYLRPLVRKGAKNDMKINNDYVLHDRIWIPCVEEQQKIVGFFSALDKRIENTRELLEQTQSYKRGLLQKMFV